MSDKRIERAQSIVGYSPNRSKWDFYPTPPIATEALLEVESFDGEIWEPACGDGAISKVLKERGHFVVSSDLINRGYGEYPIDFLDKMEARHFLLRQFNYIGGIPNIITNPPYSKGQEFVEQAIKMSSDKVAMLLKIQFLEGQKRRKMFEQFPPKKIWVFSKRLTQHRDGKKGNYSGMMCFAWFVWEKNYSGEPRIVLI